MSPHLSAIVVGLVSLGLAGGAAAAEPEAFAAMKRYCIDPDAVPAKVEAVLRADDFLPVETAPGPGSASKSFLKRVGALEYFVSTGSADLSSSRASAERSCMLAVSKPDERVFADAIRWLPAAKGLQQDGAMAIPFRRTPVGPVLLDVQDRSEVSAAVLAGEMSVISISTADDMTMLVMTRTKATP